MEWLIVIGYLVAMGAICVFSLHQLNLTRLYLKNRKADVTPDFPKVVPVVTVQLPIYNEQYVVERLIDSVCSLDYPKDKLEVQVLDDSDDATSNIVVAKVREWSQKGIDIKHIKRGSREGFKAGALQYGLKKSGGEFLAVFDADFLPHRDFLMKTIPHFSEGIGMVQTRWDHLNLNYSVLTRLQAFGLNAHFTIEQSGRASSERFMNFNGTAGVWRKACVEDAGGWQADTLTEDLDLSYRAQLGGWKFKYLESVTTPAELPILVPAIKSQQYRWNKGAAETARKHLFNILKADLSWKVKVHAAFHLLNSSVFIFLLIAALLSVPVLYVSSTGNELNGLMNAAIVFVIGFIAISIFYWTSTKSTHQKSPAKHYLINMPLFLSFMMGLTLHNAIAVSEGYLGIKTPFIRTPKFNVISSGDSWKGNVYVIKKLSPLTFFELILAAYFLAGFISSFYLNNFGLAPFHLMLALGFASVAILSFKSLAHGRA